MAQTVCFVWCNGNLCEETFPYTPTHEDFVQICSDMYFTGDEIFKDINIEYEKVEIGPGEYGADTFLADDVLVHIRNTMDWEKHIEEIFGYEVEITETGDDIVEYAEFEDDEW